MALVREGTVCGAKKVVQKRQNTNKKHAGHQSINQNTGQLNTAATAGPAAGAAAGAGNYPSYNKPTHARVPGPAGDIEMPRQPGAGVPQTTAVASEGVVRR